MGQALIIVAKEGYQDHEYAGACAGLESAGFSLTHASTGMGRCIGKYGGRIDADCVLADVDVGAFDCIVFIGGPGAAALADNEEAKRIAREAVEQGKILGAICIAPTILAKAGVLKRRRATAWDEKGRQAHTLEEEGATFTGAPVTVDGTIVTANGADAAEEFGRTIAAMAA